VVLSLCLSTPCCLFSSLFLRRPYRPTLFPYTTLFRSLEKSSTDIIRARWLQAHFRPSRFITIFRDPYAVCASTRRRYPRLTIEEDRNSTRLNSSHEWTSYAVFCLKKKKLYFDSLTVNAGNGGFLHCIQMDTSVNAAHQVVSDGAYRAFDADSKFFACLVFL